MDSEKDTKKSKSRGEAPKKSGFETWFKGLVGEFKRITWPTRKEAIKMTITVIFTSGLLAAIIMGYDFILSFLYGQITNIFT